MKSFIKENIVAILFVVISVVVTMLLVSLFRRSAPNEKAIRLEEQVKHKEEMRLKDSVYYAERLQSKDSTISALLNRSTEKQIQYVQLKDDEKKIRPVVESYSSSELLKRANDWLPD